MPCRDKNATIIYLVKPKKHRLKRTHPVNMLMLTHFEKRLLFLGIRILNINDKVVVGLSYLYDGQTSNGKMASLY